jgi:hypothetical protein
MSPITSVNWDKGARYASPGERRREPHDRKRKEGRTQRDGSADAGEKRRISGGLTGTIKRRGRWRVKLEQKTEKRAKSGGFVVGQGWNDHHHTDGSSLRTCFQSSDHGTQVFQSNQLSGIPRTTVKPSAANSSGKFHVRLLSSKIPASGHTEKVEKTLSSAPWRQGPPETAKRNRPLPQVGSGTTGADRRPADGGR